MAKLTKSATLSTLAAKTGLSKKQAGQFVDELVKLAYKEAKNSFTIPGLGKLVLVNRSGPHGTQPGHRRNDSDSCQARGEVPHCQGSERFHSRRQVTPNAFGVNSHVFWPRSYRGHLR